MHRIKNKNYNYNEINIPKRANMKIKQKKTITKEQEEQEPQDNSFINPSIFGYNTQPITYQPQLEQTEIIPIEKEPVEGFTQEEVVSTPNTEEMQDMRNEYYSKDQEIKPFDYFSESIPVSKPISKDDFNALVFFDEMP